MCPCNLIRIGVFCLFVFCSVGEIFGDGTPEYLGCYHGTVGRKWLSKEMGTFDDLTLDSCIEMCYQKGFIYSGAQDSKECFCGDYPVPKSKAADEAECSSPCGGDENVKCGGTQKLSVHQTGFPHTADIDKRVGCFKNEPGSGILTDFKTDLVENNSPKTCLNFCYQLGYKFAGVQNGFECHCGNFLPPEEKSIPPNGCTTECPGDRTWRCGGKQHLRVYNTPIPDQKRPDNPTTKPPKPTPEPDSSEESNERHCDKSLTWYNGGNPCSNEMIFFDDFNILNRTKWKAEVKYASTPDYEFTAYDNDHINLQATDGALHIRPTIVDENLVDNGNSLFPKIECTGDASKGECTKNLDRLILPPITSARITTKESFNFKYGVIDIQAKLPIGDWILSEIWLMPKDNHYGPSYQSGKIRILSRGNSNLKYKNGKEMGCQIVEGSAMIGVGDKIKAKSVYAGHSGCHEEFRKITIVWSPVDIEFLMDDEKQTIMADADGRRLSNCFDDISRAEAKIWDEGSSIAPFDQPFYISIGVSAGGIRDFEDGSETANLPKPWNNSDPRAMYKFWLAKDTWKPTWRAETSLEIKSIKVTAL